MYLSVYLRFICLSKIYLSIYLSLSLSRYLSVCLSVCLSIYLSIYLSLSLTLSLSLAISLSVCLSIYLSLSLPLSLCLSRYLSVCLSIYLQDQKRRNSARLPSCLNITTSKTKQFCEMSSFLNLATSETKQFCETSSFLDVQDIKNKRILRDVLQKWKDECRAASLVPMRFAIFPVHLSKVLRLPRKIDASSYDVPHLSRKIILANLHIWYCKMQPLSGNQRPNLLTSLMNMSFVLRLPLKMHLCRSSSNVPCLPSFLEMLQNPHLLLTFEQVQNPLRLPRETTSNLQKWTVHGVLCTFWLGNVLRATTACTFSTSQLRQVVRTPHFDFEMCFAPQRRALFRHLNFQKWSDHGVFCTFRLRNVLRATTACTFSTSQLPKAVRRSGVLYILTSRHNGVQFFITHLASWLRTRRFSEPTFRPSGATNHWKNTVFRDFPTFSRICIFCLLTLSLLLFSLLIRFHFLLSAVWIHFGIPIRG